MSAKPSTSITREQNENHLARAVSWTLTCGLTASVVLMLLGWAFTLKTTATENHAEKGWFALPLRALHGDGAALLSLGLVVLMLTPVARVLILALGWARDRDWTFSLIAFCVLALLSLSVLLGSG
jgi:uncharacterized membrane protein